MTNYNDNQTAVHIYKKIFLSVVGIIGIRVLIEWMVFDFPIQLNVIQDYVRFYLENTYYFLILFLAGSLFVSQIARLNLERVMKFGVKFYPIIWLPPLVDHFFLGRVEGYYYARVENFFLNLASVYILTKDASFGLTLEVFIGMAGLFAYVYMHTKSWVRGIVTAVALHFFLLVISTPDLFWGRAGADYYFDVFIPMNYFFPFILFYGATVFFYDRKRFKGLFCNIRFVRSLIFLVAVLLGVWVHYIVNGIVYLFNPLLACFSVFFLWQASVIINDIYDYSIDKVSNKERPLVKGIFLIKDYHLLSVILGFLALSFAAVINWKVFLLALFFFFLDYAYSAPPFRWRNHFGGNLTIGCAMMLAFLMGIYSSGYQPVNWGRIAPIGLMMFMFTTLLTLAKDIKDIEGDKKAKVVNLFTLYGKEDAKKLVAILIFVILNVALIFYFHFIVFLLGLLASYLYYKYENIIGVYLSGVIIIILLFYKLDQSMKWIP